MFLYFSVYFLVYPVYSTPSQGFLTLYTKYFNCPVQSAQLSGHLTEELSKTKSPFLPPLEWVEVRRAYGHQSSHQSRFKALWSTNKVKTCLVIGFFGALKHPFKEGGKAMCLFLNSGGT